MAANNGGAGAGGRQGNNPMNEHVEFSVKAEEDLYLTGSENTLRRVAAETNYSCLMLKTQRFSSLFRHYAKYHGLRKDDLEYYFCNILENEDTPESVQLQRGDTIMVRKRRPPPVPEAAADDEEFFRDLRELLDDEEHMDAVFYIQSRNHDNPKIFSAVPPLGKNEGTALTTPMMAATMSAATSSGTVASPMDVTSSLGDATNSADSLVQVRAHKCILAARAEYFKAYFRTGQKSEGAAFKESEECIVRVDPLFTERHIRWVLEFVYTNRVREIKQIGTDDLLYLLHLSDRWLLRDLKRLVEHELIRSHMTLNSVARLYGATEEFNAKRLSRACIEFIMTNLRQLAGNAIFEEEMKQYPHLCIPVLKAAADLIPEGPVHKKQRTDTHVHHGTPAGDPTGSSPVPDSDT